MKFERYDSGEGWAACNLDVRLHERISLQHKRVGGAKPDIELPFGMSMPAEMVKLKQPKQADLQSDASESDALAEKEAEVPWGSQARRGVTSTCTTYC